MKDFKDCIYHTTTTKFPIYQRIRHLFGAPVVIESKIFCENVPGFIKAEAKGVHTRIFKRKSKGGMEMSPPFEEGKDTTEETKTDAGSSESRVKK